MSQTAETADEVRHHLYEIMKRDAEFEEKALQALELGTEYLGVDTGFVSRIDQQTNHYETILSTDGDEGLVPAGMTTDLSGTYCRHTLERDSPLAIHDATKDERFEAVSESMHCYHGVTLTVEEEVFGTLCFGAEEPRGEPFDEAETMFAELVGRLLEHELEHRRQQAELERQTSLVNVLDRVLRHNIRNDMTVIRANAQLRAEHEDDCEECETIVRKADELIELSETARHLGKILNTEFERQHIDVATIARDLATKARREKPEASLAVDAPPELSAALLPTVEQALWELLENALEYAGDQPTIDIVVRETAECIELTVSDDGPGLPEPERDALQSGTETPLVHGSGVGLWTVYWVVTNHGGTLDIETDDGTAVTMSLPDAPLEPSEGEGPQIRRGRDRYRAVFEAASVPLVLLDDDGRIVEANGTARARLDTNLSGQRLEPVASELSATSGTDMDVVRLDTTLKRGESGVSPEDRYTLETDVVPGQHLVAIF